MIVNKDKMAVMQVLGGLINDPLLLLNPEYPLDVEFFPEVFHRYLFEAIEHLIKNKATNISYIDIDNLLSKYKNRYAIFNDNKGIEYVQSIQKMADVSNYPYYYGVLKKMSLLNDLARLGFDTTVIYNPNLIDPAQSNIMQEKFDKMTVDDIVNYFKTPLTSVEAKYAINAELQKYKAGHNAKQLKEQFKESPAMGLPLNSKKLTTIFNGRNLKKFFLKTAVTAMGKTRLSVGDACLVSALEIFDLEDMEWKINPYVTPTLLIITEQEWDEVETMLWAYVSGVNEYNIINNRYKKGEEARVDKAIEIIRKSPLYYVVISDYSFEDIELIITEHKQKYGITHVFFDYLQETEKLLYETSKKSGTRTLRTDQVLAIISQKLKALCQRLNIHLDTSTQSNDQIKAIIFADQSVISGSKAIANKPDIAYVVMPLSKADEEFAETQKNGFSETPNIVFHVYKVRRGTLNKVKVWVYFDRGNLRITDCFVTKANNELINVPDTEIHMLLDSNDTKVSSKEEVKVFDKGVKTPIREADLSFDDEDF